MSTPIRHERSDVIQRGIFWDAICTCGREFRSNRRKAASSRLSVHIADANRVACPTPEKNRYRSRIVAEREIPNIWRMLRGGPELRPYECVCGRWHLTKSVER